MEAQELISQLQSLPIWGTLLRETQYLILTNGLSTIGMSIVLYFCAYKCYRFAKAKENTEATEDTEYAVSLAFALCAGIAAIAMAMVGLSVLMYYPAPHLYLLQQIGH